MTDPIEPVEDTEIEEKVAKPKATKKPVVFLIAGESSAGKSSSLRTLKNPEGVAYLNCEVNKPLPFKSKFKEVTITDPYQVISAFNYYSKKDNYHTIVVDSLTYLLEMFESLIVNNATGYEGWKAYQEFVRHLFHVAVSNCSKNIIFTAHNLDTIDADGRVRTNVPVKGSSKNNGLESYFTTIVYAKRATIKELEKSFDPDMLHITEKEKLLGFKHVYQTGITKDTVLSRIRSPIDMFTDNQTFIDSDAQLLLDHLVAFYN